LNTGCSPDCHLALQDFASALQHYETYLHVEKENKLVAHLASILRMQKGTQAMMDLSLDEAIHHYSLVKPLV
jgi:hypothetical protein